MNSPLFRLAGFVVAFAATFADGQVPVEELPPLRRSFGEVAAPIPPFPEGRFEPRPGETIAFLGGTEVFDFDRHAFLEAGLHLAWPERKPRWRNLAWQGDTIFHQARPLYFYTRKGDPQAGSIPDHRERTEPGIVVIGFGKMESLEGVERLPNFVAAYAALLDSLAPLTARVVLLAPAPFFPSGPAASEVNSRNEALRRYVEAIRELAEQRGLLFIDGFGPLLGDLNAACSDNGVHLNEAGHRVFAGHLLGRLGASVPIAAGADSARVQSLRQAIQRKNRLWQQYYRPSNWAFLFGDRQHVPASRDVKNRDERWFVREIDGIPSLLAASEADIHRHARPADRP